MCGLAYAALHLSLIQVCLGLSILRNTLDISTFGPIGGAHLKNGQNQVALEDITICVRFNVKVLGHWENRALLVHIEDWRTDSADPDFRLMWFDAWYPVTFFGFGYPQLNGSYASYLLRDPDLDTYQIWSPNRWSHVCISYEKSKSYIRMVKDGRLLNIDFSDPNLANVIIPEDVLSKVYIGTCGAHKPGCSAPGAEFTDFNIWSRPLSKEEMTDWTSCKSMFEGDLVSWTSAEWVLENMVLEEVDWMPEQLCKPFEIGYVLFPEERNITATINLCEKFKSSVAVIESEEIQDQLIALVREQFPEENPQDRFWCGWWDEEENGVFRSIDSDQLLDANAFQPWHPGEPNGDLIENCVVVWPHRKSWNDMSCSNKAWTFCNFYTAPYFQMRGLCFDSVFDSKYSWTGHLIDGHHSFQGYKDTTLYLDPDTNLYTLRSFTKPEVYATVDSPEYPLGTFKWTLYKDPCYEANETEVWLNFNACTDDEFNCVDGNCIPISGRCDGRIDCGDKSDEISCQMIEIDQSYIKEIPASPFTKASPAKSSLLNVSISLDVLNILEINEVEGIFAVQFSLSLTWLDKRLVLNNLKEEEYLNALTKMDKDKIWIPQVVLFNTEDKEESLQDDKAQVTIYREGKYSPSSSSTLQNVHVFEGRDNPLTIRRIYSTNFLCDYNMADYPFDVQACKMSFVLKGSSDKYANLSLGSLNYLGPIDLTQYYVKEWKFYHNQVIGNQTAVEVEIILGRRVLNEILTTYFPTMLICIVSFSTNYFKVFFFEAVVTVNLTSLLVLTTLFISVSNGLPNTSYVKMIDIWLIGVMCVPFLEVILHTLVDSLREEQKDSGSQEWATAVRPVKKVAPSSQDKRLVARDEVEEVNARQQFYQTTIKRGRRDENLMRICLLILRYGLPSLFVLFSLIYFLLGFSYSKK